MHVLIYSYYETYTIMKCYVHDDKNEHRHAVFIHVSTFLYMVTYILFIPLCPISMPVHKKCVDNNSKIMANVRNFAFLRIQFLRHTFLILFEELFLKNENPILNKNTPFTSKCWKIPFLYNPMLKKKEEKSNLKQWL